MKTTLLTAICIICFTGKISAQVAELPEPVATNSVFVEFGGSSILYAFNYDARIDRTHLDGLGYRFGFGGFAVSEFSFFSVPLAMNYLIGKNDKFFEISGGATFIFGNDYSLYSSTVNNFYVAGSIYFGYRSQPSDGGYQFRAGLPFNFGVIEGETIALPYPPGISFGFCF